MEQATQREGKSDEADDIWDIAEDGLESVIVFTASPPEVWPMSDSS
jgi:hypothetical protein